MRIGVPRSLLYYLYFPLWDTFFEELGAEVVVSSKSNKAILTAGAKVCAGDACIPLKLFHGHVIDLLGKVDFLFVPRLKSVAPGEYICPKFCGLPDMLRYSVENLPPLIDTEVDLRKKSGNLAKAFEDAGRYVCKDLAKIRDAARKALFQNALFEAGLERGGFPEELIGGREAKRIRGEGLRVAVLGHVYNVYDDFINMEIFESLRKAGIRAFSAESIPNQFTDRYAAELPKKLFWTFARKLIGAARYLADTGGADGVIYISSFGCGIDSFAADICLRAFKKAGIPFYLMVIDEHSGEAGFATRLEAFLDMLQRRTAHGCDLPAHGERVYSGQNGL